MTIDDLKIQIIRKVENGLNRRRDLNDLILTPQVLPSHITLAVNDLLGEGTLLEYQRFNGEKAYKLPGQPTVGAHAGPEGEKPPTAPGEWVKIAEAAKILGVGAITARGLLNEHKIVSRISPSKHPYGRPPFEYRRPGVLMLKAKLAESGAKRGKPEAAGGMQAVRQLLDAYDAGKLSEVALVGKLRGLVAA